MSRTDAHTPYRVRVARRELAVHAVHRCAGRECDLPDLVADWSIGRVGRCYWEFAYSGINVCSCWMCHWRSRPEPRRSSRGARRVELRGVARRWSEVGAVDRQRAADILAFFDRPGTSNGPTEAINGRLEHLRGSALGFRNLTHYIARSLLEAGGFRPHLHP
ncbi:hypothetical protein GCM10009624_29290 [Gordonia sinesedis]